MSEEPKRKHSKRTPILVIGHDPGYRSSLAKSIEEARPGVHRVESVSPDALPDPTRFAEVGCAIVILTRKEDPNDFEGWASLRELRCASRLLVAIAPDSRPAAADLLIGTLEPRAVIDLPATRYALASALDRTLPCQSDHSARAQHRSTQGLLGISRAIREITDQVRQISASRISVLILGETGTGKEVVARALHRESPRSGGPFIALNCGALPESLLESELFGNERGAFTGATHARAGVFEQADGGTLFLDEIGEMPAPMQVKLLRTLEDGKIRRLGGTAMIPTDVRIVSATHRNLEIEVAESRFRQDLLFRLNTSSILLPPLRRRAVDIPFLAQHFAEEFGAENARDISLSEDFLSALCEHNYPGNIRELRNAVERAIAMATPGDPISAEHLPDNLRQQITPQESGTLKERVAQLETRVLQETLTKLDGNRTRTAEELGLSRAGLRQKLSRLGIE